VLVWRNNCNDYRARFPAVALDTRQWYERHHESFSTYG
jgi:hypothetical protein